MQQPASDPSAPPRSTPLPRTPLVLGGYSGDQGRGLGLTSLDEDGFCDAVALDGPDGPSWVVRLGDDELLMVAEGADEVVRVRVGGDGSSAATSTITARTSSGGMAPCHLAVTGDGRWGIVANYVSGSVGLLDLSRRGVELVDTLELEGEGPHERQDSSHAHQVVVVGDRDLLVCDLGADRIRRVSIDESRADGDAGTAPTLRHTSDIGLPPGTGPRHLALDDSSGTELIHVVGELDLALHTLRPDGTHLGSVSLAPDGRAPGENTAAGIVVADGHAYVTVRGTDTLSVVVLGEEPALRQQVVVGHWPRFVGWVPGREGERLLVACERAGLVQEVEVDEDLVTPSGVTLGWPGVTWVG